MSDILTTTVTLTNTLGSPTATTTKTTTTSAPSASSTTTTHPASTTTPPPTNSTGSQNSVDTVATNTPVQSTPPPFLASTNNSSVTAPGSGISPGAAAGIGIGTFIAGVVLTFLGFCLFLMLKKKNPRNGRSRHRHHSSRGVAYYHDNETPMKDMATSVTQQEVGNDMKIERILLEPVSGSDIKTDMMTIGDQIRQHVDNNYHLQPVNHTSAKLSETLAPYRYESSTGINHEHLSSLLRDVRTRHAAIRHLISWIIFSRIALTSDTDTSLLPPYITAFLRKIPQPEKSPGSREGKLFSSTTFLRLSITYKILTKKTKQHSTSHLLNGVSHPPTSSKPCAQTVTLSSHMKPISNPP